MTRCEFCGGKTHVSASFQLPDAHVRRQYRRCTKCKEKQTTVTLPATVLTIILPTNRIISAEIMFTPY